MTVGERSGGRWSISMLILAVVTAIPTAAGAHGAPSPETYRWVTPPAGIESAGEPGSASATYPAPMFAGGFATAWTPDVQATVLLTVPDGVTPSDTDVAMEPIDGTVLGPIPAALDPNGNAYRITVDGDGWHPDVRVQLTTPYPATELWAHTVEDGWRPLSSQVLDSGEVLADVPTAVEGVTVLASWTPPTHRWWQRLTHSPRNVAIAAVVAGGAGWAIGTRRPAGRRREKVEP